MISSTAPRAEDRCPGLNHMTVNNQGLQENNLPSTPPTGLTDGKYDLERLSHCTGESLLQTGWKPLCMQLPSPIFIKSL